MLLKETYMGQLCTVTHNYPDKTKTGMLVRVYDIAEVNGFATSPTTGQFYSYSPTKVGVLVTGEGLSHSPSELGWCFIEPEYLMEVVTTSGQLKTLAESLMNKLKSLFSPNQNCGTAGLAYA